eukprot:4473948-Pyramimonas_sp.AAC.1
MGRGCRGGLTVRHGCTLAHVSTVAEAVQLMAELQAVRARPGPDAACVEGQSIVLAGIQLAELVQAPTVAKGLQHLRGLGVRVPGHLRRA